MTRHAEYVIRYTLEQPAMLWEGDYLETEPFGKTFLLHTLLPWLPLCTHTMPIYTNFANT